MFIKVVIEIFALIIESMDVVISVQKLIRDEAGWRAVLNSI